MEGLKEVGNVDVLEPVKENGAVIGKVNGNGSEEKRVECVVIGGGLAGLSTGGRLKALGIAYLILDKNQNVGDNWKLRYGSARCEFPAHFHKF